MFINFLYLLRNSGIPVSPTAFLQLQKALSMGHITSLNDFYTIARSLMVKTEKQFDLYDQVFADYFQGQDLPATNEFEISEAIKDMVLEWLKSPQDLSEALGIDKADLREMSHEELVRYFMDRLQDQTGGHHGGNYWIGTKGASPVGHSGYQPGGMRVGGYSQNQSALKVALDRRYKEYSDDVPLTQENIGEALKKLRNLLPAGPKDKVNVQETIRQTMKNAGEIEIIFDRRLKDKLKIILAIDNGGWSMDPYVQIVQILFKYARYQFKDVKTYYFHNTIYDYLWEDPYRQFKPYKVEDLAKIDPETRFIIVGDANMGPSELMLTDGSVGLTEKSGLPSLERLKFIAKVLPYSVWINPIMSKDWGNSYSIKVIRQIFPMFELSISGLEQAVEYLKGTRN